MEKVCFETRGLAGLVVWVVSGPETNVSDPWERLVSGSGNKGLEPEKFVFRPESNVSETGQEN